MWVKALTDGVNHTEFLESGYKVSFYDLNIRSIHFYHNLIFIHKGYNNEPSPGGEKERKRQAGKT